MADAAIRQLVILSMLPRSPRMLSTPEVYERVKNAGFSVTAKTVERDLLSLERHFALLCDQESKPYRWSFQELSGAFRSLQLLTCQASASRWL